MSTDPIVALNNYLQSVGRAAALSWKDSASGLTHSPEWKSVCKISGEEYGVGIGTHKHIARGAAAALALEALKLEAEVESREAAGESGEAAGESGEAAGESGEAAGESGEGEGESGEAASKSGEAEGENGGKPK